MVSEQIHRLLKLRSLSKSKNSPHNHQKTGWLIKEYSNSRDYTDSKAFVSVSLKQDSTWVQRHSLCLPRIIQQMDRSSSRNLCMSFVTGVSLKDGGREWTFWTMTCRFISQAHAESRGEGGWGRVSWRLKEEGFLWSGWGEIKIININSLSRNFSYRAVGPPLDPPSFVVFLGWWTLCRLQNF